MKVLLKSLLAFSALLPLLQTSVVLAQDGLALMKVESGARPAGMAGAFTSINDHADAIAYNPAGGAITGEMKTSIGYNTYWENVSLQTGYLALTASDHLSIHAGLRFASVSDLEARVTPTLEPEGYFDAHDVSFKAGLAYRPGDRLTAGLAAGWFLEKIDDYRGSSFNVDLGLQYQATDALRLGVSALNLGSDLNLSLAAKPGADIPIPTTYRAGGSYKYDIFLGAIDFVYLDEEAHVHVGAEGQLHERLALRGGYMAGYDSKDFSAGATFTHRNFDFDYAFVPYSNDLGTSHLFTLTVSL